MSQRTLDLINDARSLAAKAHVYIILGKDHKDYAEAQAAIYEVMTALELVKLHYQKQNPQLGQGRKTSA